MTKNTEPTLFSSTKTIHPPDLMRICRDTFTSKLTTPLMLTAQHSHPSLHPAVVCPSQLRRCTKRTCELCYLERCEGCTPSTQSSATGTSLVTPIVLLSLQCHHTHRERIYPRQLSYNSPEYCSTDLSCYYTLVPIQPLLNVTSIKSQGLSLENFGYDGSCSGSGEGKAREPLLLFS